MIDIRDIIAVTAIIIFILFIIICCGEPFRHIRSVGINNDITTIDIHTIDIDLFTYVTIGKNIHHRAMLNKHINWRYFVLDKLKDYHDNKLKVVNDALLPQSRFNYKK